MTHPGYRDKAARDQGGLGSGGIVAAGVKRVAAGNPPQTSQAAPYGSVFSDGSDEILTATRLEPAILAQPGTDRPLVTADCPNDDLCRQASKNFPEFHGGPACLRRSFTWEGRAGAEVFAPGELLARAMIAGVGAGMVWPTVEVNIPGQVQGARADSSETPRGLPASSDSCEQPRPLSAKPSVPIEEIPGHSGHRTRPTNRQPLNSGVRRRARILAHVAAAISWRIPTGS